MSKVRHALPIAALMLALAASTARASETLASPAWFEQLIVQILAVAVGHEEPPGAASVAPAPDGELELGEHAPVSG